MKHILNKKIKASVFALLLCCDILCFGQGQDYINHAKYWLYRSRLRNDFLLVGPGQGMSIPMQERGYEYSPYADTPHYNFNSSPTGSDGRAAKWGDSMGDLGYYIGVLATEYNLLKTNNNQSGDSTLKELYYALYALNRMDYNAEVLWRKVVQNDPNAGNTPLCNSTNGCLDGAMCRDDVDFDFVSNNYAHFNYYGNHGFYSPIKINNEMASGHHQTGWSSAYYETGGSYQGGFLSQDNWYNVLLGLTLVRKFIPNGITYSNLSFQDGENRIYDEAYNIADRVYNYFTTCLVIDPLHMSLFYPDHATKISSGNGGAILPYFFAHAEALGRIRNTSWNYYNPTEGTHNLAFHDACDRHQYLHTGHWLKDAWRQSFGIAARWAGYYFPVQQHNTSGTQPYADRQAELTWKVAYGYSTNANDVDENVIISNLSAICNCNYDFVSNNTGSRMSYPEFQGVWVNTPNGGQTSQQIDLYHAKLVHAALFGFENCGYGEDNPYPSNEMSNVANNLLPSAPCEGTYAYNSGDGPTAPTQWRTTLLLDHPERTYKPQVDFPAEYNGLDYMLYHNLYYVVRNMQTQDHENKLVDFSNRILTLPYPLSTPNTPSGNPWGSSANPATIGAYELMGVKCVFNNNAVADLKAGKEISLQNGFSSIQGSDVSLNIKHLTCTDIFNQDNSYDNVAARGVNNGNDRPHEYYVSLPTSLDSSGSKNNTSKANNDTRNDASPIIKKSVTQAGTSTSLNSNIAVYPNPNSGAFTLLLNSPDKIRKVELQSIMGETLYQASNGFVTENKIDISNLPAGFYILNVYDNSNNVCTKKIIKN